MKKVFIFLFLASYFISCRKSNTSFIAGNYSSANSIIIGDVTMYVKNQQIKDTSYIKQFLLRRTGILGGYFIFDSTSIVNTQPISIDIFSNNSVSLTYQNNYTTRDTTVADTIISQSPSELILANRDSSVAQVPVDLSSITPGRCDTLDSIVKQVHRDYILFIHEPVSYFWFYKYRPKFPVGINNGQLTFYLLTSFVSFSLPTTFYGCYDEASNQWNAPTDDFMNNLTDGDTIILQTNRLPLTNH